MRFRSWFDRVDAAIAGWMQRYGLLLLRLSIGLIFVWFGGLKFYPESEIYVLVEHTVPWGRPQIVIPVLGVWEIVIGVCMVLRWLRVALALLVLHMPGTILPLFTLPEVCFTITPIVPTVAGQYIIKNMVLISAAIVVGGTARRIATDRIVV